jgi:hypothetical protein
MPAAPVGTAGSARRRGRGPGLVRGRLARTGTGRASTAPTIGILGVGKRQCAAGTTGEQAGSQKTGCRRDSHPRHHVVTTPHGTALCGGGNLPDCRISRSNCLLWNKIRCRARTPAADAWYGR